MYRLLALFLIIFICGCSSSYDSGSGFLPYPEKLKDMSERAPFDAAWVPSEEHLHSLKSVYHTVVVPPVDISFVEQTIRKLRISERAMEIRIADLESLADYFRERMRQNFEAHGFKVADEPTPDSFVWEVALVELVPTTPSLHVITAIAGFFVKGSGVLNIAGSGSIGIETVVRDGNSGDILAAFKDREGDKLAPFTIKDFQMYAHARVSMDEWSEQFAELAATTSDHKVDDSLPVSLNPF
jgi:hypothetical protein